MLASASRRPGRRPALDRVERMSRPVIVQKFGGSSVATPEHISSVADQVVRRHRAGFDLVVVVSAMGQATDELLGMARQLSAEPDRRELDMLLTVGERITMALLALAIRERGLQAVSLTGSQSGIMTTASHTNARIMEVRPFRVQDELARGRIVIVAGYQGVSYQREITTLGRGGSDTTAVALAAALDAEACEIYSDVDGVWTADPRVVEGAQRIDTLDLEAMSAMARSGARVLHSRAVEYAREKGIALYARKTGADEGGTVIRRHAPEDAGEVVAISHRERVLRVDRPRDAARSVTAALTAAGARLDQSTLMQGELRCLFDTTDLVALPPVLHGAEAEGWACVTAVGRGPAADFRLTERALEALVSDRVEVESVWIEPSAAHLVVPRGSVREAARRLHATFGLSAP